MKELYVIYNSQVELPDGGHPIDGGAAKIDREWDEAHKDGSTQSERIPLILKKKEGRKVDYLPKQTVPDSEKYKFKDGKIVEMTEADIQVMEAAKPKSEIEVLKERVAKLENK